MGTGRTDEFRKDAVRIALTSGLSQRQVADDLGVEMSTLNKWVTAAASLNPGSPRPRVRLFCPTQVAGCWSAGRTSLVGKT
jgi:transposase-like protein